MKTAALTASVMVMALSGAAAAGVAGAAAGVAGAAAAGVADAAPLRVSPAIGHPSATFQLYYQEPARGFADDTRADAVTLIGPARTGCVSSENLSERPAALGAEVLVRLRPGARRRWCVGTFRGSVRETITPRCAAGQMCPMFIALVPIGNFRFVVRR